MSSNNNNVDTLSLTNALKFIDVNQKKLKDTITQLSDAYYKLPPVLKDIQVGPRGGLFYINNQGYRHYLTPHQREMCEEGMLVGAGVGGVCGRRRQGGVSGGGGGGSKKQKKRKSRRSK